MSGADAIHAARVDLLRRLKRLGYAFVTVTPATHRRVLGRPAPEGPASLRDVLGWSRPFHERDIPPEILRALEAADALTPAPEGLKAAVRVSSLGDDLFLHSAFPPRGKDAVFLGPDTYRFAALIRTELQGRARPAVAVDVGAGAGCGAMTVARAAAAERLVLTDVNSQALAFARANFEAAEVAAEFVLTEGLDGVDAPLDLVVANPPYIAGATGSTYSEGGDMHGARLSLDWALDGARRLAPGGRMILYTGSAIVDGRDGLREALSAQVDRLAYRELDPDVFGNMLSSPPYADVDRIAAVAAIIDRD